MEQFLARLLDASLQGVIAFAAVLVLVSTFKGLHPATKCWLWRLCGIKFLLSLVFIANLPVLQPNVKPTVAPPIPDIPTHAILDSVTAATTYFRPQSITVTDWSILLPVIWGLGAFAVLTGRIVKNSRLRSRLMRSTTPFEGDKQGSTARLLISPHLESPVLVGIWNPAIILPAVIVDQPDELSMAIAHETAHLQRRDIPWQTVLSLITCLFWFLPPTHWIEKMSKSEAELATDRAVIETTGYHAVQYGRFLVRLARQSNEHFGSLGMAAATRKSLERRIKAMSHSSTQRKPLLIAVAVLSIPALIPWQAIAQTSKAEPPVDQRLDQLARGYFMLEGTENEIRLTAEQKDALEKLGKKAGEELRAFGQKLEDMKTAGVSDKDRLGYDQTMRMPMFHRHLMERWNILTLEQKARQRQIVMQFFGPMILGNESIAKPLRLNPQQIKALADLNKQYQEFMSQQSREDWHSFNAMLGIREVKIRELTGSEKQRLAQITKERYTASGKKRQDLGAEYDNIRRRAYRYEGDHTSKPAGFNEKRSAAVKELMTVRRREWSRLTAKALQQLTSDQRKRWTAMLGKPITFKHLEAGGAWVIAYR